MWEGLAPDPHQHGVTKLLSSVSFVEGNRISLFSLHFPREEYAMGLLLALSSLRSVLISLPFFLKAVVVLMDL